MTEQEKAVLAANSREKGYKRFESELVKAQGETADALIATGNAQRRMLESQAREAELRAALQQARRMHMDTVGDLHARTCDTHDGHGSCNCGASALTRPTDDSALREFGESVRVETLNRVTNNHPTLDVVDAVLRGER